MKLKLNGSNNKILKTLRALGSLADRHGVAAYAVGGFVRDLLLKRKNLDVDVVLEGDAVAFATAFAGSLGKVEKTALKVYKDFGTATLFYPNGFRLDMASARKEFYPRPGALPIVSEGSIRDDLFRRDFTINAMAVVINESRFGEVVDIFAGGNDLKSGRIRILHNKSFLDDPTRILRAVRFEQRFDFKIEPQTSALLKSAIQNDSVREVTPARYFAEFKKILKEPYPIKAVKRLAQLGALGFLKEGLRPNFGALALLDKNISGIQRAAPYKDYKEWWLMYLMGIMESWGPSQTANFIDALNLTRREKAALLTCRRSLAIIKRLQAKNLKPRQVYEILKPLDTAIIYFIRVRTSVKIVNRFVDNFVKNYSKIHLHVTGADLKEAGIPEGKQMGKILNEILLRKIDGKLTSRKEEIREVAKLKN